MQMLSTKNSVISVSRVIGDGAQKLYTYNEEILKANRREAFTKISSSFYRDPVNINELSVELTGWFTSGIKIVCFNAVILVFLVRISEDWWVLPGLPTSEPTERTAGIREKGSAQADIMLELHLWGPITNTGNILGGAPIPSKCCYAISNFTVQKFINDGLKNPEIERFCKMVGTRKIFVAPTAQGLDAIRDSRSGLFMTTHDYIFAIVKYDGYRDLNCIFSTPSKHHMITGAIRAGCLFCGREIRETNWVYPFVRSTELEAHMPYSCCGGCREAGCEFSLLALHL